VLLKLRNTLTNDVDDAGIYGGVHYRFDQEAGAVSGKHEEEYVLSHALQPCAERSRRSASGERR
jgi:hypothetical protein